MSNPRSYSKVGKRKKALSSRKKSPALRDQWMRNTLEISFTDEFRDYRGEMITTPVTRVISERSDIACAITKHFRSPKTYNSLRVFRPRNQDFRPILWLYAKPYYRKSYSLYGLRPEIEEVFQTRGEVNPASVVISGKYPIAWDLPGFRDEPLWSDRQDHYLNFNKKLGDQKVDVLTTLAEAKTTVTMVANAANDMFRFYRAVKRADVKTIKHLLRRKKITKSVSKGWRNKTAESRWLELQYGWKPMVADLKTAFEECVADKRPAPPIIKVMHSTKVNPEDYIIDRTMTDASFFGIIKTVCYFTVESKGIREAAQWNLGNNPLLTAWELVPYSFVVDWFLPIGDFLQQFSAGQGLQFVDGSTTWYFKGVGIRSRNSNTLQCRMKLSNKVEFFVTGRDTHNASPIGFPTFNAGLSTGRALNALALISQRR